MDKNLFNPFQLGSIQLSSRIIMAPLTRCRAINGNVPNSLMAEYYGQRAGAGLVIAEGTSPSPDGLGYTNIPGMFNEEHAKAWQQSTKAIHEKGGKVFLQLMHTGRIAHSDNLPEGATVYGPSAIAQPGQISTYNLGKQHYPVPTAMSLEKVESCIEEFVESARLSIAANFDGIEIHCAHGYLPNQFINTASNNRTDQYGGSIENRCRFVLEIAKRSIATIGADKVAIRISPFSYADDNEDVDTLVKTYEYLTEQLNELGLVYIHLSNMSEMTPIKQQLWTKIRTIFKGTLIICGDFTKETAQVAVNENKADLIAFGRDYIGNPDLVKRFKNNWSLAERNKQGWYGSGAEGYTNYSFYQED
jgi:N-ethylmaleimide reductase